MDKKPIELNSQDMLAWVDKKLKAQRLPLPAKPKSADPEFLVPDDPSKLSVTELGQRMLRAAGWYAYAQRLLGVCESELVFVDAEYKLKINVGALDLRKEVGRVNQEAIEAMVVANNESLTPLYERRIKMHAIKKRLESQLLIFEKVYSALSREQSRRELEARVSGG